MSQNLLNLSYTVIHNSIQFKMDKIADVFIHGLPYFTVFRRYNSPYEIVLEDMKGETYVHKDQTMRESLQTVLCLSSQHASQMYTNSAHSYRHHAPVCPFATDLADLRWTDIQDLYGAVFVDFGGILLEFQEVCEQYAKAQQPFGQAEQAQQAEAQQPFGQAEQEQPFGQAEQPFGQEPPRTPPMKERRREAPNAPQRRQVKNEIIYADSPSSQDLQDEPWAVLIPITEESLVPRIPCKWNCEEKEEESAEEDDTHFIVLRNGTRIRKIQTQKSQKKQKKQKY